MNSVDIITFGCRLNIYESEVIRSNAAKAGLKEAIIINTCSVTNEAERQARQAVRRAKRDHPHKKIIVTGCSAQLNPDLYREMEEVDYVVGNAEKMTVEAFSLRDAEKVQVNDIMALREGAAHLISGFENHVRAFIEIQNGCNHRCTFCTIPFSRGPHRSVPMGALVNQIKTLVEQGCQEVVLTGVDITDYGQDLPGKPCLSSFVRRLLNTVPDLPRLRLSSLDPKEIDEEFIELFQRESRLMPHVHLSLQSGDPMILKRMKRRHSPQDALRIVSLLKEARPDCVFGADIIAGFPTETDEMFTNTLYHLKACGIIYLHTFPYSARKGTPAARMPQVKGDIIHRRAHLLRAWGDSQLSTFLEGKIGRFERVLVERTLEGRAEDYTPVVFPKTPDMQGLVGKIITVKGVAIKNKKLEGDPFPIEKKDVF